MSELDSFTLPRGFGFARLLKEQLAAREDLLDCFALWERPRKRGHHRYILGVDVSDGMQKDRSVVAVHRMGTIEEPEEQVALYCSDQVAPAALAYVVDAIGRLYCDQDGFEALAAIECNNHGLSTQDTLTLHLGYGHTYVWEYLDSHDPKRRFSTKAGWVTTSRTRPLLLDKLKSALTTRDPVTGQTELLIHSAILRGELADFQTEGALWEAAAARGAFDDCVMATAIAHYIAWRLQGGEQEPLSERRTRLHQEQEARTNAAVGSGLHQRRDYRNTAMTATEAKVMATDEDDSVYDDRHSPAFLA